MKALSRPALPGRPIRAHLRVKAAATQPQSESDVLTREEAQDLLAKNAALAVDYEYGYRTRTSVSSINQRVDAIPEGKPRSNFEFSTPTSVSMNRMDIQIPFNVVQLAVNNFARELKGLRRFVRYSQFEEMRAKTSTTAFNRVGWKVHETALGQLRALDEFLETHEVLSKLTPPKAVPGVENQSKMSELRGKLALLTLSNQAVWDREEAMYKQGQGVKGTPWFVKIAYLALCFMLDVLFDGRPIQRFWFLETVARMPYFCYISMLHLYESLGWWRAGTELRKIHFAEEYNELTHLLTMESLGGDQLWIDRFIAQHAAIFYYWILIGLFLFSPETAYNFSELIETHAVHTYGQFVDENEALLKTLPPPRVAVEYYKSGDLYYYEQFQSSKFGAEQPRPKCESLYDVFSNIRDDEGEHVKTIKACQDGQIIQDLIRKKEKDLAFLRAILAEEEEERRTGGAGLGASAAADGGSSEDRRGVGGEGVSLGGGAAAKP